MIFLFCTYGIPPYSLSHAHVFLFQFLLLKKDEELFRDWLKGVGWTDANYIKRDFY